jgi:hypothetical protein
MLTMFNVLILIIYIFKYCLLCFERSEQDWEMAVDPRGELFYIESNPLEKARHSSAEVVEKADTPKFLGKLHQNRHTTRGLSLKHAVIVTGCNRFFLFSILLRSKLKIHLLKNILLLLMIMTSKMETLSFQFSVPFFKY